MVGVDLLPFQRTHVGRVIQSLARPLHSALREPRSGGGNDLIGGGDAAATHMLDAFLIRQAAKCGLHSRVGNAHAVTDLTSGEVEQVSAR